MTDLCECFHKQPKVYYTYDSQTGLPISHNTEVGVCYGTKELDECSCEGHRLACTFYPKVRRDALEEVRGKDTTADDFTYYVVRNRNTGLYFRGKGANKWGKYYNQASIYRIKKHAENTVEEEGRCGSNCEVVPIQIIEKI